MGNDEFAFEFKKITELTETLEITRRNILRINTIFNDPLGCFSPITARMKSIFQLLCKDKNRWDESVTEEIKNVLDCICRLFERAEDCEPNVRVTSIYMHRFCDSSKHIFSAVI